MNGINCALTPGTVNPITVNTINQTATRSSMSRTETAPTYDTQFDGFTVVLTCRAAVNPGVPNTMRLVIADASDDILDSAVFLQASGVSSNPIGPLQPITPTGCSTPGSSATVPPLARLLDADDRARRAVRSASRSPAAMYPTRRSPWR